MMTTTNYEIEPCSEYGLYQVVNTKSGMRTKPANLPATEKTLRWLRRNEEKLAR